MVYILLEDKKKNPIQIMQRRTLLLQIETMHFGLCDSGESINERKQDLSTTSTILPSSFNFFLRNSSWVGWKNTSFFPIGSKIIRNFVHKGCLYESIIFAGPYQSAQTDRDQHKPLFS